MGLGGILGSVNFEAGEGCEHGDVEVMISVAVVVVPKPLIKNPLCS
jgi:hypothetical protein